MGIEPTSSLFPSRSPVLKTGAGTSRTRTPKDLRQRDINQTPAAVFKAESAAS